MPTTPGDPDGGLVISIETAWERLVPYLAPLPARRAALADAAGRALAEEVRATVDVPFADVSAMDGYAVAGAVEAGARLPVLGRVAAGEVSAVALPAGGAMRIMTGRRCRPAPTAWCRSKRPTAIARRSSCACRLGRERTCAGVARSIAEAMRCSRRAIA
jgi:hypothetical protein